MSNLDNLPGFSVLTHSMTIRGFIFTLAFLGVLTCRAAAREVAVDVVRFTEPAGWSAAADRAEGAKAYTSTEAEASGRATIIVFGESRRPGDLRENLALVVARTVQSRSVVDRTEVAGIRTRQGYDAVAQNLVARGPREDELLVQVVLADVGGRLAGFCYASPTRAAWDRHAGEMSALLASARFEPKVTAPPSTPPAVVALPVREEVLGIDALYRPRAASPAELQAYLKDASGRRHAALVCGTVLGDDGLPIPGAKLEVRLRGTTGAGDAVNLSVEVTRDGHFQQPVPDGVYKLTARARVDYNGAATPLPLRALDEQPTNAELASAGGIVKDYRVTMFGLIPGEDPKNVFSYFGGTLGCNDASTDLFNDLNTRLEKGTTIRVTLTPTGPLIDGSKGKALALDFAVERLHLNSVGFGSLPIGVYRATAVALPAQGSPKVLRIGTVANALAESAEVTWQGAGADGEILTCPQLYVGG